MWNNMITTFLDMFTFALHAEMICLKPCISYLSAPIVHREPKVNKTMVKIHMNHEKQNAQPKDVA